MWILFLFQPGIETLLRSLCYIEFMGITKRSDYHSYLLRLWRVEEYIGQEWRGLLENVENGEKRGFANPEELLAYLEEVILEENVTSSEGSQTKVQG